MAVKEKWFLWRDGLRDPYMNMALDELLLDGIMETGRPLVRIYGWDRPSVSIGYVQKFRAAPREGHAVVRRPTGGGVVFHGSDLTYTVVVPEGHLIAGFDRMESYHVFHRVVLRMLKASGRTGSLSSTEHPVPDRATMRCFETPTRYDVMSGGKKYAGAAQRRTKDGVLHQGSISLSEADGDAAAVSSALVRAFEEELAVEFDEFAPHAALLEAARSLAESKYSTDAWNMSK